MTSPADYPRQRSEVVTSEVLDEIVIYCPGSSQAVSLNASARAIWELCDGTRSIDDVCAELSNSVDVPAEQLRSDVSIALARLLELGVLQGGTS